MPLPLYPIPLVQVQADSSQLPNPSCTPVPVNSLTSTDLVGSKAASLEVDLASVRQRNAELVVKGQEDAVSRHGSQPPETQILTETQKSPERRVGRRALLLW